MSWSKLLIFVGKIFQAKHANSNHSIARFSVILDLQKWAPPCLWCTDLWPPLQPTSGAVLKPRETRFSVAHNFTQRCGRCNSRCELHSLLFEGTPWLSWALQAVGLLGDKEGQHQVPSMVWIRVPTIDEPGHKKLGLGVAVPAHASATDILLLRGS